MKIAIYGRTVEKEHKAFLGQLFIQLKEMDATVFVHQRFFDALSNVLKLNTPVTVFKSRREIDGPVDMLFSLGGDGTILDTVTYIGKSDIPILGINLGRLGFLANTSMDEISEVLRRIKCKEYTIEKRDLICVNTENELFGKHNFALNEFSVIKKDSSSMLVIHTYINNEFVNSYWSDGLIIATPTGSTAYSLSCGGPIIVPGTDVFIINPIAPHNLNVRPIIVPDNVTIKLKIEGREEKYLASLDSRSKALNAGEWLAIEKASFSINLVKFEDYSFFKTLRNKLHWGLDKRN
ncbi:MAG: NAD kinase [Flavobacteriales bacterium]